MFLLEKKQANSQVPARALVNYTSLIFIDDVMFIEKSKRYSMAFENQFHYGVFYSYLKLREMEIKNIVWLAELVSIGVPR
jgi:V-type H+-transporting ATPase subunit d